MKKRYVLIPAYKPGETLLSFIQALEERNLKVIVVDDGSGEEYLPLFQKMEDNTGVKLIQLEQNRGKGAALKAGLSYLQTLDGNFQIITVDADGQHSLQDTLFLLEEGEEHENCLLLGSRTQSGSSPLRSRLGNAITRKVFSLTTGVPIRDTQTGLRCFGKELIPDLLAIPGNRYEYEMNVLLEFARAGIPILEYPIETIYLNDNAGSHFDTVKDSFRIYGQILKFISTSLLSFLLDFLLYSLCFAYTGQIFLSNALARILSLHANFFLNKNFVFAKRQVVHKADCGDTHSKIHAPFRDYISYLGLALFLFLINSLLLSGIVNSLNVNAYFAKILTELALFLFSYYVQKNLIFNHRENEERNHVTESPC